jgi:hypothetical protein
VYIIISIIQVSASPPGAARRLAGPGIAGGPLVARPGSILSIPAPTPEAAVGAVREPPLRKPLEKVGIFLQDISGTQH